jgi:hypothetical protein
VDLENEQVCWIEARLEPEVMALQPREDEEEVVVELAAGGFLLRDLSKTELARAFPNLNQVR